jgi:hypothetical protein
VPVAVILATQEAELRRIAVQRHPGKRVHKNPSQKRAGGEVQGVDQTLSSSPSTTKKQQTNKQKPGVPSGVWEVLYKSLHLISTTML